MENALFATLDTAVRRARAKDGRQYAYVDTVGFVRRLPTQLIEAFKSTLEEVSEADLIVHVVDGSHPDPFSQIDAVDDVLSDIDGVETIPTIIVFNKADRMDEATRERIEALMPEAYIVSAFSGEGVDELRMQVESMLPTPNVHVEALLPYTAGSLVSRVREYGKVINVEYRDDGMMLEAEVDDHWLRKSWNSQSAENLAKQCNATDTAFVSAHIFCDAYHFSLFASRVITP